MDALGCSLAEASHFVEAYNTSFEGIYAFKLKGSKFVRENGYITICKYTGHKLYWEDWKKWKDIENTPSYIYNYEYTEAEKSEHEGAGAKWDRKALNAPTQGTGIIILKLAMINYFKWIVNNNLFNKVLICDLIHDKIPLCRG